MVILWFCHLHWANDLCLTVLFCPIKDSYWLCEKLFKEYSSCFYIKAFLLTAELVSDCKKCCTEDSDDSMSKVLMHIFFGRCDVYDIIVVLHI